MISLERLNKLLPADMTEPLKKSKYCLIIFLLICIYSSPLLTADSSSTGVRIYPGYYFPVNDPVFKPGLGASAAFDFTPLPFLSIFAQGEYVNIGLENVEPLALTDGSIGAGLLWQMNDRLTLRTDLMTGIYSVSRNETSISGISAGTRIEGTYHVSPVLSTSVYGAYRHYAYTPEPFMNSLSIGVGISINLKEALSRERNISAEKEEQEPVFPVLYSWYDDNPFSIIKITNNEKNTITDVKTSFYLEQYMGQPKECSSFESLKPGESFDVPISAFFKETMLELSEPLNAQAKIIVEYRRLGAKQKAEIPVTMNVFHRNAMSWEDDRRAAAFVSSKDPAALWFSKYVSSIVNDRFRMGLNKNMQYAMGIFEALDIYGTNYVIDPSSSYAEIADNSTAIDFLQYPYQTLMYRGGDCDDLSILYSSLLEAIGIDTAFITIPGHIFMAFSSGMTEAEAKESFYAPELLIYHDGIAWVPIEITLIKEDFNKAWRIGAKEWNDADSRGTANILPMKESWKIYKPVSIPGAVSRFSLPDETKTAIAFDKTLNNYAEREIRPQIRHYEELLAVSDTPENRNKLGVLYGKYGMIEQAKTEFTKAARGKDMNAWTNLGNILFIEQKYDEALTYYNYVLSIDKKNSLALLGAARCNYELDDFGNSDAMYASLQKQDAPLSRKYAYLGSFFDTRGRAWSLADRLSTTEWSLPPEAPAAPAAPAETISTEKSAEPAVLHEETDLQEEAQESPADEPEAAAAAEDFPLNGNAGLSSMLSLTGEGNNNLAQIPAAAEQPVLEPVLAADEGPADLPVIAVPEEGPSVAVTEDTSPAVIEKTTGEEADKVIETAEAEPGTEQKEIFPVEVPAASLELALSDIPEAEVPSAGLRGSEISPDILESEEIIKPPAPAVKPVLPEPPSVKEITVIEAEPAAEAPIVEELPAAPVPAAPIPESTETVKTESPSKTAFPIALMAFIAAAAAFTAVFAREKLRSLRKKLKSKNRTAEKKKTIINKREGTDYDKTH